MKKKVVKKTAAAAPKVTKKKATKKKVTKKKATAQKRLPPKRLSMKAAHKAQRDILDDIVDGIVRKLKREFDAWPEEFMGEEVRWALAEEFGYKARIDEVDKRSREWQRFRKHRTFNM